MTPTVKMFAIRKRFANAPHLAANSWSCFVEPLQEKVAHQPDLEVVRVTVEPLDAPQPEPPKTPELNWESIAFFLANQLFTQCRALNANKRAKPEKLRADLHTTVLQALDALQKQKLLQLSSPQEILDLGQRLVEQLAPAPVQPEPPTPSVECPNQP